MPGAWNAGHYILPEESFFLSNGGKDCVSAVFCPSVAADRMVANRRCETAAYVMVKAATKGLTKFWTLQRVNGCREWLL